MKQDENGKVYFEIDDIMSEIKSLARSQGFYGRLYESLCETRDNDAESWQNIVEALEAKKFRTSLDMVLFFEQ